jgi:murein DD-endopeptidase MepM/ murein hydrolase activator NlpD
VAAFRAGRVIEPSRPLGGLGNTVIIDHGGGLTSYYAHLSSKLAVVGQTVNAGDVIGIEGSTGNSTGPHVHFEVHTGNTPVNPRNYLRGNP